MMLEQSGEKRVQEAQGTVRAAVLIQISKAAVEKTGLLFILGLYYAVFGFKTR